MGESGLSSPISVCKEIFRLQTNHLLSSMGTVYTKTKKTSSNIIIDTNNETMTIDEGDGFNKLRMKFKLHKAGCLEDMDVGKNICDPIPTGRFPGDILAEAASLQPSDNRLGLLIEEYLHPAASTTLSLHKIRDLGGKVKRQEWINKCGSAPFYPGVTSEMNDNMILAFHAIDKNTVVLKVCADVETAM